MTLFERLAELMQDGRDYTRRELIDATDASPSRVGECLQKAVKRGAIEQTTDTPMRFRLIDGDNKTSRGGVPPPPKPKFWVMPKSEPRQWWQV